MGKFVTGSPGGGTSRDAQGSGTIPRDLARGAPAQPPPCNDTRVFTGKVWVPKQKPMDPVLESVTLEPELEEALANASDAELCDIAGNSRSFLKSSRKV